MNKYKILFGNENKKLIVLILLLFVGAIMEMLGVSIILPIVNIAVSPEIIHDNKILSGLFNLGGFKNDTVFIIFLSIALLALYFLKTCYMFFMCKYQYKTIYTSMEQCTNAVMKQFLYKPYEYYLVTNTSEIQRTIFDDVSRAWIAINSLVQIIADGMLAIALAALLFFVNPKLSIVSFCVVGVALLGIRFCVKPIMVKIGIERQTVGKEKMKWINQSVWGIKDIKVARRESFFINEFQKSNHKMAQMERMFYTIGSVPRLSIDMISMVMIILVMVITLLGGQSFADGLPSLATFAVASIRFLPSVSRINGNLTTLSYYRASIESVASILQNKEKETEEKDKEKLDKLVFNEVIEGRDLSFRYPDTDKYLFKHMNFSVYKGQFIGVVGSSGAGKTTLVDIVMGLLKPSQGGIFVDGQNIEEAKEKWINNIGYIPQDIYMIDDSIRNNIIFGDCSVKDSDKRLEEVLNDTQLKEFVEGLADGLDTVIGDRGIRISGGQKQRIGIARALYRNPDILIFDEATSALDMETEKDIMDAINVLKGKKTMIIIAHRINTTEKCDLIFKVENGAIKVLKDIQG